MKSAIYLRLSLLIPLFVWGVCLMFFIIASASPLNELVSSKSTIITDLIIRFLGLYIFGIIIWIFPYLLLALALISLSFIIRARIAIKVFALSPIAMTILTISLVNLLAMSASGDSAILSNPLIKDQGLVGFNILLLVVSLIWGYICVGLGFGIYKMLQHSRIIIDEGNVESKLRTFNQYESRGY